MVYDSLSVYSMSLTGFSPSWTIIKEYQLWEILKKTLYNIVILCMCMYIGFKTSFYVVRHLDSIASYLPTGLNLGFFRSWPSLYLPSSFSSVFLVLSFVSASTSMLFWVIFLLPFFEHGLFFWYEIEQLRQFIVFIFSILFLFITILLLARFLPLKVTVFVLLFANFSPHLDVNTSSLCTEICTASSESSTITWSSVIRSVLMSLFLEISTPFICYSFHSVII